MFYDYYSFLSDQDTNKFLFYVGIIQIQIPYLNIDFTN